MPKFTIDHQSTQNVEEAYQKIKEFLSNDQDIRRFDPKIQCSFNESAKSAALKGSQFKADMAVVSSGTGCKVSVTVDLPLMLTPFKGKVQETLQRKLAKYLA
ncbi:polyhydroxyalkanoic acid system family protein [Bdellovibrio sp. 22V]|uniref:polyhydroxyalkanoic acid system family protein n=1 Tax=Bdellovibrio TaxID=958 RepID=UPI0025435E1D|nr:polyhydroxyalkanoic acid system family protein [Bdellovibrio sp. 22V]WII73137.1 polyhydroxyalkanoic acid system family protein [Bdellovibrio sp. 22V]